MKKKLLLTLITLSTNHLFCADAAKREPTEMTIRAKINNPRIKDIGDTTRYFELFCPCDLTQSEFTTRLKAHDQLISTYELQKKADGAIKEHLIAFYAARELQGPNAVLDLKQGETALDVCCSARDKDASRTGIATLVIKLLKTHRRGIPIYLTREKRPKMDRFLQAQGFKVVTDAEHPTGENSDVVKELFKGSTTSHKQETMVAYRLDNGFRS